MIAWLIVATALAGQPDELDAEWLSLGLVRPDTSRYRVVKEPFTVTRGPLSVTIDEGLLVPVFSGHIAEDKGAIRSIKARNWELSDGHAIPKTDRGSLGFIGFVWVGGSGSYSLEWTERGDSLTFADHMVRDLGADKADWIDVAHGAPLTGVAKEGLFLDLDPTLLDQFLGPDDQGHDPLEVIVYDEKERPGALLRSRTLLHDRLERMQLVGVNAGGWIGEDRLAISRGYTDEGRHSVIDVHIDGNLGWMDRSKNDQPPDIDWMTLLRDETGLMDSRRAITVNALDVDSDDTSVLWRITGVPFPPSDPNNPLSAPLAPVRLESEDAYVITTVAPQAAEASVTVVARLQLRAVGGTIGWFDLNIPRSGSRKNIKFVSAATIDGVSVVSEHPLLIHDPVLGIASGGDDAQTRKGREEQLQLPEDMVQAEISGQSTAEVTSEDFGMKRPMGMLSRSFQATPVSDPYHDRPESRIRIVPPQPLKPGDKLVIDVTWKDRWPYANLHVQDVGIGEGSIATDLGTGTGAQNVIPRLPGSPQGNPSKFRIRVAVPDRNAVNVACSGALLFTRREGDWVVWESGWVQDRVPYADVAVGKFRVHDEAGAYGLPAVRTRLDASDYGGREMAAEARRQILFYQGFLPPYPWPEYEVVQVPGVANPAALVWAARHEMTPVSTTATMNLEYAAELAREDGKRTGQMLLAHETAHQWWGQLVRPAHVDDFWFTETFAEAYARMYLGAVGEDYDAAMAYKRDEWESFENVRVPRASLTDAYSSEYQRKIVLHYGPYVFQQMLRPRISHFAYHGALDLLVADFAHGALTTEQIEEYFSLASKQDLSDFFDFWVYAGFIPQKVELEWRWEDGQVVGEITSDVPFGTFDVPVVVDGGEPVRVLVVDGVGRVAIPSAAEPEEVALDPAGEILAERRVVHRR